MPGFDLEFGRVVYVITDQKESMAHLSCQHWQRPPRWQYWVSSRICSRRKSLLLYKWSKEWNRSSWLWSRLFACWSCCLMAQSSDPAPLRVNVHMKSSLGGGGRTSNAIEINESAWIVFLLYTAFHRWIQAGNGGKLQMQPSRAHPDYQSSCRYVCIRFLPVSWNRRRYFK